MKTEEQHGAGAAAETSGQYFQAARKSVSTFWERVSDGLQLGELWNQFAEEARAGYGHYSKEVDWEKLSQEKGLRRGALVARSLFWALLMKLSPARRVFLIFLLALLGLNLLGVRTFGWPLWADILAVATGLFILLALELADRVTMKRDLEIARDIQSWLVPARPPAVEGVDIAFATRPANTVAGDFFDAFLRAPSAAAAHGSDGQGRLLLTVADVAGKSVPAALLMATFQASLHTLASSPIDLLGLVRGLNRYASAHSLGGVRFTTAFLAEYDRATRTLHYVNAGHNAPVLRRVSGAVERLEAQGVPLGIRAEEPYSLQALPLQRHDVLVIFTDGVVETFNAGNEEYGDARLKDLLNVVPGESAEQILRHLFADVDRFAGGVRQNDDMTCLILRVV